MAHSLRERTALAVLEALFCVAVALEHLAARADALAYLVTRWGGLEADPAPEEVERARAWMRGEDVDG